MADYIWEGDRQVAYIRSALSGLLSVVRCIRRRADRGLHLHRERQSKAAGFVRIRTPVR